MDVKLHMDEASGILTNPLRKTVSRGCGAAGTSFSFRHIDRSGYIGEFEMIDDHRGGKIVVNLTGRLNKCGVISPRFDVQVKELERWQNGLLPSRQFGYQLLSELSLNI
ncbi:hypothetical protein scyTo_0017323 [Scyliorhinus torazame]|uniref:40S ribosomal protein S15a n=1 Tax=Scyliorhinus torazame TaxID=75743 RepID=A0A401PQB0_SCYTO|nr:hypothetical protein [Scyliorhinus torazame]